MDDARRPAGQGARLQRPLPWLLASTVVGVVMGGDLADVRLWAGELSALNERFLHLFSREELRQSALAYMPSLGAPLERKNGWTLAEEAEQAAPIASTGC